MTVLELLTGFLIVPTLGAVALVLLSMSRRSISRSGRDRARLFLGGLGWIYYLHAGLFLCAGLMSPYAVLSPEGFLGWLARLVAVIALIAAGRAARIVSRHADQQTADELPVTQQRVQDDERDELLTAAVIICGLPLFIPGLLGLTCVAVLLLLEDLIRGVSLSVRQNRLLWTLAQATRQNRNPADDIEALALAQEQEIRGSYWRWVLRWGRRDVRALRRLAAELDRGLPLSFAMVSSRVRLSPEALGTIAMAEQAELLPTVLPQLAQREAIRLSHREVTGTIYTTMFYLWVVWVALMTVVSFMVYNIMPRFQQIFDDFGTRLPLLTQRLIADAEIGLSYWYVLIPLTSLPITGLLFAQRLLNGDHRWLRWLLRWFPRLETPYLLDQLAWLIQYGKDLPGPLQTLADFERQPAYRRRIERVQALVAAGNPLHQSLQTERLIQPREAAALEAASRMQHLPWALHAISDGLLLRRRQTFQWWLALGEPLLLLLFGVLIGLFAIGMFLPLVQLLEQLA
jgi:type II secretory pathway component PulF